MKMMMILIENDNASEVLERTASQEKEAQWKSFVRVVEPVICIRTTRAATFGRQLSRL
jgi:hypothetical protein